MRNWSRWANRVIWHRSKTGRYSITLVGAGKQPRYRAAFLNHALATS